MGYDCVWLTLGEHPLPALPQRQALRRVMRLQNHLQPVYWGGGCPADGATEGCRHGQGVAGAACQELGKQKVQGTKGLGRPMRAYLRRASGMINSLMHGLCYALELNQQA